MPHFIDRNFDSPLDLVRPPRPALELARLGASGARHGVGRRFDDERLRRLFSFQSLYAGLAPYEALAIYAVITYMDTVRGVVSPEGGMHAVPRALAAAARRRLTFRYDTPVERILLARGAAGPVRRRPAAGGECSPPTPSCATPTCRSPTARCSRASPRRVPWPRGSRRRPWCGTPASAAPCRPTSPHHNIHFGRSWDGSFDALLDDGSACPTRRCW